MNSVDSGQRNRVLAHVYLHVIWYTCLFFACCFGFVGRVFAGRTCRERQMHIEHTYIGNRFNISEWLHVFEDTHTHKQTNTPLFACTVYIRYSTTADLVWKVCPDDVLICSRKLMKHRAPEVHEPQRRQPKAYLQAATSHASICLVLVYIIVSSVTLGSETSKYWDSPAEHRFLFNKARTYCITILGIWNSAVSVGGLCCASKISWISWAPPSVIDVIFTCLSSVVYLRSSATWRQRKGGRKKNQ